MTQTIKIGIIGAGVMGIGLAHVFAQGKHLVTLIDVSDDVLEKARAQIFNNIRRQFFFTGQRPTEDSETILGRIHFSTHIEELSQVHYVIENATEQWNIKKRIYEQIDKICPPFVIFAVNTSTYSIAQVAELTHRPTQVIGLHFMNPAPLKR